jgi:uncharacterized protein
MERDPSGRRIPRIRDLKPADLPAEIGVFPLAGALLLPGGKLPLNVFEPRYVALVEDALAGNRLFGMIQPSGPEPTAEGKRSVSDLLVPPALYRVGCLGRLSSFTEREDGTFAITLSGLCRFRLHHELDQLHGYRRIAADYAPFIADLKEAEPPALDREALLAALQRYFTARGFDARWEALEQMDDETLVTTLSMICPLPPAEKQALLEAETLTDRAFTLQTLLEMAGHEHEGDGPPHAA